MKVQGGCVVSLDYSVQLADGRVVESSTGKGPLEYLQGAGQILPALEKSLEGLEEGEKRQFVFGPEDAFGERENDNLLALPRVVFPPDVSLAPGTRLSARNSAGQQMTITVREVNEETVMVDLNHPLAGETLFFTVAIRGVRRASDDEVFLGKVRAPAEA